jgi:lipopolysaccharide transport system permease protein
LLPPPADDPAERAGAAEAVIRARRGWGALELRELWGYRELLFFLAWRDVKVRYQQTALGVAWAALQPALLMVVFTLSLGRLAGGYTGGHPYALFVYAGLLPWTLFAAALSHAGGSVINNERLITRVYFPRLLVPFAAAGPALIDFLVATALLGALMLGYGAAPGWSLLLLPAVALLIVLAALGVGAILAALNVAYRDFRYVVPFLVQVWMFATPTIYLPPAESSALPFRLNPMTGLVAFFRAAALGDDLPWGPLGYSAAAAVAAFAAGCYWFRRAEDSFADII